MVDRQLRRRGIEDERVLAAMEEVPRELFLPEDMRGRAYRDGALRIGEGQTMSQPWIVACMAQLLELEGLETVLEVGTGSGYAAAVLSRLCRYVVTIERFESLAERAREVLAELGYDNVEVRVGDGAPSGGRGRAVHRDRCTAAPGNQTEGGSGMRVPKAVAALALVVAAANGLLQSQPAPARVQFRDARGRVWHKDTVYAVAGRCYIDSSMSDDPWISSHLELRSESGEILSGYGWIFPLGNGEVNIGVGTPIM